MVESFPRKVSKNYGTVEFSNFKPFKNRKFQIFREQGEFKENFPERKKFENLGIPRKVVLFFGNFGKYCSFCSWKLTKNSNRTFWLNGKCPWLLTNCYKNNYDITSVILVLIPHHEAVSEGTEDRLPLLNQQCVKSTIACKSPIALSLGSEM